MVVSLIPGKSDSLKQVTIGIAILILISKGIGFLREMVIAYKFGTSIEYDVYLVSISIPVAIYSLFSYIISVLFVPAYTRAAADIDRESSMKSLWTEFNLCLLVGVISIVMIIVAAPFLIKLIAPGLNPQYLPEAVLITRVSTVIIAFSIFEAFSRSILNAEKKFMIPAAAPIVASLVMIGSVVVFSGQLSTLAVLFGLVGGYLAQAIVVMVPFNRIGLWKMWHARFIKPHLGKFFVAAVFILLIEATAQIYSIVDRYFASSMNPGVVSSLGYSYLVVMLPIAIFAYALSTALFPYMSDAFVGEDQSRSAYLISRGISVSLLLAIPATLILWVFGEKVTVIFFQRGAFNEQSVVYTSNLLKYFALGLSGNFVLWVVTRAYYASGKYFFLVVQTVLALMVKIVITPLAISAWGYIGLAISSSVSYTLGALILIAGIRKYLVRFDEKKLVIYLIKLILAAVVAYVVAQFLYDRFVSRLQGLVETASGLLLAVAVTLIVFGAVGYLLRIPDISEFLKMHIRPRNSDAAN